MRRKKKGRTRIRGGSGSGGDRGRVGGEMEGCRNSSCCESLEVGNVMNM